MITPGDLELKGGDEKIAPSESVAIEPPAVPRQNDKLGRGAGSVDKLKDRRLARISMALRCCQLKDCQFRTVKKAIGSERSEWDKRVTSLFRAASGNVVFSLDQLYRMGSRSQSFLSNRDLLGIDMQGKPKTLKNTIFSEFILPEIRYFGGIPESKFYSKAMVDPRLQRVIFDADSLLDEKYYKVKLYHGGNGLDVDLEVVRELDQVLFSESRTPITKMVVRSVFDSKAGHDRSFSVRNEVMMPLGLPILWEQPEDGIHFNHYARCRAFNLESTVFVDADKRVLMMMFEYVNVSDEVCDAIGDILVANHIPVA
jgi:hypothetical protein